MEEFKHEHAAAKNEQLKTAGNLRMAVKWLILDAILPTFCPGKKLAGILQHCLSLTKPALDHDSGKNPQTKCMSYLEVRGMCENMEFSSA